MWNILPAGGTQQRRVPVHRQKKEAADHTAGKPSPKSVLPLTQALSSVTLWDSTPVSATLIVTITWVSVCPHRYVGQYLPMSEFSQDFCTKMAKAPRQKEWPCSRLTLAEIHSGLSNFPAKNFTATRAPDAGRIHSIGGQIHQRTRSTIGKLIQPANSLLLQFCSVSSHNRAGSGLFQYHVQILGMGCSARLRCRHWVTAGRNFRL